MAVVAVVAVVEGVEAVVGVGAGVVLLLLLAAAVVDGHDPGEPGSSAGGLLVRETVSRNSPAGGGRRRRRVRTKSERLQETGTSESSAASRPKVLVAEQPGARRECSWSGCCEKASQRTTEKRRGLAEGRRQAKPGAAVQTDDARAPRPDRGGGGTRRTQTKRVSRTPCASYSNMNPAVSVPSTSKGKKDNVHTDGEMQDANGGGAATGASDGLLLPSLCSFPPPSQARVHPVGLDARGEAVQAGARIGPAEGARTRARARLGGRDAHAGAGRVGRDGGRAWLFSAARAGTPAQHPPAD